MLKRIRPFFIILFLSVTSLFSQEDRDFLNWAQIKVLPRGIEFKGEVDGYLSIFKMDDFWNIYLYDTKESLKEHRRTCYIKISYEEVGKVLKFTEADIEFFRALDNRFVKLYAKFRTPELSVDNEALKIENLEAILWRNKDGKWSDLKDECLEVNQDVSGKNLKFPRAEFFAPGKATGKAEGGSQ